MLTWELARAGVVLGFGQAQLGAQHLTASRPPGLALSFCSSACAVLVTVWLQVGSCHRLPWAACPCWT